MSETNEEARERFEDATAPRPPLFLGGSDRPGEYGEPQNIAAVVAKYLSPAPILHGEEMRNFSLRMTEVDLLRLSLLAEALGTGKTSLARELLDKAISEAYRSLPETMREELRQRFLEEV